MADLTDLELKGHLLNIYTKPEMSDVELDFRIVSDSCAYEKLPSQCNLTPASKSVVVFKYMGHPKFLSRADILSPFVPRPHLFLLFVNAHT